MLAWKGGLPQPSPMWDGSPGQHFDCSLWDPEAYRLEVLKNYGDILHGKRETRTWVIRVLDQGPFSSTPMYPSGVYKNINAAYKLPVPRKGSNYPLYKSKHASVGAGVCIFVFCALLEFDLYSNMSIHQHKSVFPLQSNLAVTNIKGNHFIGGNRGLVTQLLVLRKICPLGLLLPGWHWFNWKTAEKWLFHLHLKQLEWVRECLIVIPIASFHNYHELLGRDKEETHTDWPPAGQIASASSYWAHRIPLPVKWVFLNFCP